MIHVGGSDDQHALRLLAAIAGPLAYRLSRDTSGDAPSPWHIFEEAQDLADRLWDHVDPSPTDLATNDDALGRAINHPAGHLAEFWVHAVSAAWTEAPDTWSGLSHRLRASLDRMLDGADGRTQAVETVFCWRASLLLRRDHEWCRSHLLPSFDWGNPPRARRAWDGFLSWGRWNEQALSATGYWRAISLASNT